MKLSHFHSFSDLLYKVLYIRNFHYCPLSNVMNGYQPTPIPDELLKLFFFLKKKRLWDLVVCWVQNVFQMISGLAG